MVMLLKFREAVHLNNKGVTALLGAKPIMAMKFFSQSLAKMKEELVKVSSAKKNTKTSKDDDCVTASRGDGSTQEESKNEINDNYSSSDTTTSTSTMHVIKESKMMQVIGQAPSIISIPSTHGMPESIVFNQAIMITIPMLNEDNSSRSSNVSPSTTIKVVKEGDDANATSTATAPTAPYFTNDEYEHIIHIYTATVIFNLALTYHRMAAAALSSAATCSSSSSCYVRSIMVEYKRHITNAEALYETALRLLNDICVVNLHIGLILKLACIINLSHVLSSLQEQEQDNYSSSSFSSDGSGCCTEDKIRKTLINYVPPISDIRKPLFEKNDVQELLSKLLLLLFVESAAPTSNVVAGAA